MATIGSATTMGCYILEDESGWVAANTPNSADLSALTDGDSYVFLEDVDFVGYNLDNNKSGMFEGIEILPIYQGRNQSYTLGHHRVSLTIRGICTHGSAAKFEKFAKLNNRHDDQQKYFVQQFGSTSFRQFPNSSGAFKKYTRVIATTYTDNLSGTAGKDSMKYEFNVFEVWNT